MADFSISDMPWLGQPADPAGSLARGIQAGSMIAQTRNQRESLALRRMEFEEHQKERAKLLPLEITLKKQQEQLNANLIETALEQRQNIVNSQSVMNGLAREISASMQDPEKGPEDAQLKLLQSIVHSPGIVETPRFQQMSKLVGDSLSAKLRLIEERNKARAASASVYTPGFETIINPQTGKTHVVFKSGAGSAQLMDDTATPKPQSTLGKLFADRNAAKLAGDNDAVGAFDKVIALQQAEKGFSLTTNPDGTVTATYGGTGGGNVPAAMVSRAEENISGSVNASKLGATLVNKLRPEDLGVLGAGGEIIVDRGLAQMFPGLANKKRVDARTLLKMFRNDFTQALKIDTQMSEPERKAIESMLPSEGLNESLPSAIQKIQTATKEAAERARFAAQRAGRELPVELLKPDELFERVKRKELTVEQAIEIAKSSPFREEFDVYIKK